MHPIPGRHSSKPLLAKIKVYASLRLGTTGNEARSRTRPRNRQPVSTSSAQYAASWFPVTALGLEPRPWTARLQFACWPPILFQNG